MYHYKKINVMPKFPAKISRLNELAYNLWWTWNLDILKVFKLIDQEKWEQCKQNPVVFLRNVSQSKLEQAAADPFYMQEYDHVLERFDSYINDSNTWYQQKYADISNLRIAYFSAEYGLHEILPIYSGGLGVLSGDHCKTASDLGLNFTAVGLLYQHGYFDQHIKADGWSESYSNPLNFNDLPIQPLLNKEGQEVIVPINFPKRVIYVKVWEVKIGRIILYLLDTNNDQNMHEDRRILSNLYGGDQETRICQEIILGMGGIKVLNEIGLKPDIIHMNEGHSAFASLAMLHRYMKDDGLNFKEAKEAAAASSIFTTHTPVPAGTDTFPLHLIDKYFEGYWVAMGVSRRQFLETGLTTDWNGNEVYNMTALGLRLSGRKNGVSKIHGMVSRNIFNYLWPSIPEEEVPIMHITNGVHIESWLAPEYGSLIEKYIDDNWKHRIQDQSFWNQIDQIPNQELWNVHILLKKKNLLNLKNRLWRQRMRHGKPAADLYELEKLLDPKTLIIGFARRFATYKRAALIFTDLDRLIRIMNNPEKPVHLIFSGKAHPADQPGKELIKKIHEHAQHPDLKGKIHFIENYNMQVARYLVQGVDVWLNNPKKPLEASGTSGQKAGLNGCINFSVLDGWWAEGYNAKNGWAIGDYSYVENPNNQDIIDADHLYNTLEHEIIPLYYAQSTNGIPEEWIQKMKESIKSIGYHFSSKRMLMEYTEKMYIPALDRVQHIRRENYIPIRDLAQFKETLNHNWSKVELRYANTPAQSVNQLTAGQSMEVACIINPANLPLSNIKVETYYGIIGKDGLFEEAEVFPMTIDSDTDQNNQLYKGTIMFRDGGEYGYTFRAIPYHSGFVNKHETGLIKWADQN